ncbi:MAG: hypothetical protein OEW12_03950, partial [Deltaproteobacteria bacterium]|nr:hypothetical protein [Deltaproteobacteria bacterium]
MTRSSLIAASAALNQTPLDWTGNRDRILRAIALARAEGADVLCLPELCVSGYGCEDSFHSESVAAYAMASLLEIAPHTQEMAVAAGLPVMHRGRLYNGVALMAGGRVVGFGAKRVLAGYGVYYEPRWFTPWKSGAVDWITLATPQGTQNVPMGDLAFNLDGVVVAFEICEEAWGRSTPPGGVSGKWSGRGDVETLAEAAPPEGAISSLETPPLPGGSRPFLETPPLPGGSRHSLETQPEMGGELSDGMADLILNPSASHFAFGKHSTTRNIVLEGSRESQAGYLYANLLGNESGRLIFDGSALVASGGTLLAATPRFSYAGVQVACAGVDIRANRLERRRRAYPPDMADRPPPRPVRVDFSFRQPLGLPPQAAPGALRQPEGNTPQPNGALHPPDGALHPPNTTSWDSALSPAENTRREFTRAVALGLFDYLRKSRSRGLMVSLSGGVDSSTVAVLGWAMIKLALAELGEEGLQAALGHIPGLDGLTGPDPARFARRLITTVYQATANSTPVTREAAASVARYLGVRHLELDVEPLVA